MSLKRSLGKRKGVSQLLSDMIVRRAQAHEARTAQLPQMVAQAREQAQAVAVQQAAARMAQLDHQAYQNLRVTRWNQTITTAGAGSTASTTGTYWITPSNLSGVGGWAAGAQAWYDEVEAKDPDLRMDVGL